MARSFRLLACLLILVASGVVSAQRPTRPSGGFTPFRERGFAGTAVSAAALDQPGCPLVVAIERLDRNERGMTLSLRITNQGSGPTPRQVFDAWIVALDGTVRGSGTLESTRSIAAGKSRQISFTVRASALPNDVIVVAVQQSAGTPPWREGRDELERAARAAVIR